MFADLGAKRLILARELSIEEIALRTQSGHSHRTFPVPAPFNSLQSVAPLFCLNFSRICLVIAGVLFPLVRKPATIEAPIKAPQVLSIPPIPAAKPEPSSVICSSVKPILSWNTFNTDCAQLYWPVAL